MLDFVGMKDAQGFSSNNEVHTLVVHLWLPADKYNQIS